MIGKDVKISLCICTMNRPNDVDKCLRSVMEGRFRPEEITVSDDSQDGSLTRKIVSNFPGVKYQEGPHRGLGPNRNACIKASKGTHLVFIDDDVCVPESFFETINYLLKTNPNKTIITGYELNYLQGFPEKVKPHNVDFWGFQRNEIVDQYRSIVINASVFPAQLFQEIYFDENLRYGCDEVDVSQHAIALGYTIAYNDDLYVHHYPSPINRDHYKRFIDASRIYIMTKSYWFYERSFLKAILFFILAPLQIMGSSVRHRNKEQFFNAFHSSKIAIEYLLKTSQE